MDHVRPLHKLAKSDYIYSKGEYMDRLGAMAQFVRVVEAGSFSAAARNLGQGQPAISKAVAQLEERLGVRLITRTTRALMLTDAGRAFYERAKTTLDAAEEADAAARGAGAALSGRLRICAPVTFARLHIIPHLPGFMATHPGLDLDLVLDDRRIDLIEEGIDVAIRAGALADSSMVATHIATGQRQVVGSPDFWRNHKPVRTPSNIGNLPFIAYGEAPGGTDWIFAKDGKTELVQMAPRLRVSALEGIREAIFAGIGFAIISEWSTSDAVSQRKAETRLDAYSLPSVDLWAIYPAGRQPSARARAFADFMRSMSLGN
jgi:DNA-binding transcriptional LysR family regulator